MAEVSYYDLSGGINLSVTKTELGLDTKKIYWSDSKNIEILSNKGIVKQKGNIRFCHLNEAEQITSLTELVSKSYNKLLITTISGKMYVYDPFKDEFSLLDKTLTGKRPRFISFLNGLVGISESDGLFYVKDNLDNKEGKYEVIDCDLKNSSDEYVVDGVLAVYRGRVFVAHGSTIYYSALGTYDDFKTEEDAGYIRDFHTDTDAITALMPYREYLAIYKKNRVYLLSGIDASDFEITPFADKGSYTDRAIVNIENKQYFLSNGIFALEQAGILNQIQIGSEISTKIRPEFDNFTNSGLENSFCIPYPKKNQVWYFFNYSNDEYFHTIWINDYVNKAWYKRVVPQNLTCAVLFNGEILTADDKGNIYKEDTGNSFDGKAIDFMWKSPFLSITDAHHRKTIDEFYFILDNSYDNDFNFSIYKDYDSEFSDDVEHVYCFHEEHFVWGDDSESFTANQCWAKDEDKYPIWAVNTDTMEKAEISEANYSIQLCVEGSELTNSCAIIGLHFKEVYVDD